MMEYEHAKQLKELDNLRRKSLENWINPPWYTKLWRWIRLTYWRIYWKLFIPSNVYIEIGSGFTELVIMRDDEPVEVYSYRYLRTLGNKELRKIIKELV